MTIVNDDYIEIRGPQSLAALLAAIDSAVVTSHIRPCGEVAILGLGNDVYAQAQYDAVDADTWPYMIHIEARNDGLAPVRPATERIVELLRTAGWAFRMACDADGTLVTSEQVTGDA